MIEIIQLVREKIVLVATVMLFWGILLIYTSEFQNGWVREWLNYLGIVFTSLGLAIWVTNWVRMLGDILIDMWKMWKYL